MGKCGDQTPTVDSRRQFVGICGGIFTARRYASAVYAVVVCVSVRPSVCLSVTSRHCSLPKQLNAKSCKQRHTIAHGLNFYDAKNLDEIDTGSSPTGAPNIGGKVQIGDFRPTSRYISERVQYRDIVIMEHYNKNFIYALYRTVLFPVTLSTPNKPIFII